MPITDPTIPLRVLEALRSAEIRFVVLHKEPLVGTSDLNSDLDLVAAMPAPAALDLVRETLRADGLRVAVLWPYDLGRTATAFITTTNGDEGAQIDFLFDPMGRGRYGVRTEEVLRRAISGVRFPVPDPIDQQLYLTRKGACKNQRDRVQEGLVGLTSLTSADEAVYRARQLFSRSAAFEMIHLIRGSASVKSVRPSRVVGTVWRWFGRVRRPVGLWAELVGPEAAAEVGAGLLERRFSRWLVRTGRGRRVAGGLGVFWWLRQVAPVRLRAGLFVSWARQASWPPADLTIQTGGEGGLDEMASAIVEAFVTRAKR